MNNLVHNGDEPIGLRDKWEVKFTSIQNYILLLNKKPVFNIYYSIYSTIDY